MMYQAILTSHTNPVLSGVAKFNQILGNKLDIPVEGLARWRRSGTGPYLLSLKLNDWQPEERMGMERLAEELARAEAAYDLFFHTYDALEVEVLLVRGCRKVFCGNEEIRERLRGCGKPLVLGWAPALLDTATAKFESQLNFFSFGMAHKIPLSMHQNLARVLGKLESDYTLWLSTAFHERAKLGDFDGVSRSLLDIYGERVRFLGFLSDDSVNYFLARASAFVAFFDKGLRSNNTSVFAAMERGCPVITNLDRFSPRWLEHGRNILDIARLCGDDLTGPRLKSIGPVGTTAARTNASWEGLTRLLADFGGEEIGSRFQDPSPSEKSLAES